MGRVQLGQTHNGITIDPKEQREEGGQKEGDKNRSGKFLNTFIRRNPIKPGQRMQKNGQ